MDFEPGNRPPPRFPLPNLDRAQRAPLSQQYHKRVRLGTNLAVGFIIFGCLIYDWDSYLGTDKHVFKGIRPTIRRTLDWMWGVEAPEQPAGGNRDRK